MNQQRFRGLESLAREAGLDPRTFKKEVQTLISDPEVNARMGPIKARRLTLLQARILIQELPCLHHLANC